ncbi:MAG: histidinol dehydrogenase [Clostridia bacterium]|nr:histidinol dehydrogenase [Clostridia bacterium]
MSVPILKYGKDDMSRVFGRTQLDNSEYISTVNAIIEDVRNRGDKALFDYALKFDRQVIDETSILVSDDEIDDAYKKVDKSLVESIRRAKQSILEYHSRQRDKFSNEFFSAGANKTSTLGWIYRPLARVGLYVPGGKASYPSTVLMTALPAIAAGVGEVIVTTPNINNPAILVACKECGIDKIYKVGGAQAIAAMAYGTKSLPRVDLIAGPGNVFVTLAKKQVFGHVAIDMIAGPSEILVIADDSADPKLLASDLLSKAEHDELAASILATSSQKIAEQVRDELDRQTELLARKEIITKSLNANGAIIVADNIDEAIKIADEVAPEHLEVCARNAHDVAMKLSNAGAIFVGNFSPEPLGDYFAGPSHVLPTSGSARYSSVLSVDTFMKKISYINYSKDDLLSAADDIISIAESEGFGAHANTIKIRKAEFGDKETK